MQSARESPRPLPVKRHSSKGRIEPWRTCDSLVRLGLPLVLRRSIPECVRVGARTAAEPSPLPDVRRRFASMRSEPDRKDSA